MSSFDQEFRIRPEMHVEEGFLQAQPCAAKLGQGRLRPEERPEGWKRAAL